LLRAMREEDDFQHRLQNGGRDTVVRSEQADSPIEDCSPARGHVSLARLLYGMEYP
jgi:hypothetical protein